MVLDTSKGSILEGFEKLLGRVLIPSLQKQEVRNNTKSTKNQSHFTRILGLIFYIEFPELG